MNQMNLVTMWPLICIWNEGINNILPVVIVVTLFMMCIHFIRAFNHDLRVPIRDTTGKHNWKHISILAYKPCWCSVCEAMMVAGEGVFCDCCGVFADLDCVKPADLNIKCKVTVYTGEDSMLHHWVQGNLPLGVTCDVCEDDCGAELGLTDWQCCWCQRTVHAGCLKLLSQVCDFGSYRHFIIPPSSVVVKKRRGKMKLELQSVKQTGWEIWEPLIVMANCKSGNSEGDVILSNFRHLLNPSQVFDLSDTTPDVGLQWCSLLGDYNTTVLVAGGDGTVAWVLNTIHKLNLKPEPAVAIIPLGTGNDLSRVLGWGEVYSAKSDNQSILNLIKKAQRVSLDRWMITVEPCRHLGIRMPSHSLFMYNYLSIGVDAQVALNFHQTRESSLYLFSSRLLNKLLYFGYGTQQVLERDCQDLDKVVEIFLDGVKADLPSIESIVVLNIPCWGAGVRLWDMLEDRELDEEQSFSDGKLEVVALFSSFHIAQLQVGLSQPHRLGQAKVVEIKLNSTSPVQVDGEPWLQAPSTIKISFDSKATVLQMTENCSS